MPGLMDACPPLLFRAWQRYWMEEYNRPDKATAYLQQIDVTLRAANAKDPADVRWDDSRIPEPVRVPLTDADRAGKPRRGKRFPWEAVPGSPGPGLPADPAAVEAELFKRERVGMLATTVAPGPDGKPRAGVGRQLEVVVKTRTRAEARALNIPLPPLSGEDGYVEPTGMLGGR